MQKALGPLPKKVEKIPGVYKKRSGSVRNFKTK